MATDRVSIKHLAIKHNSQKKDYAYMLDAYEKYLPKKAKNVLEIGCLYGGFTFALREFYKCNIELIDLFHPDFTLTVEQARNEGFIPHQGDQGDIEFLKTITTQFDVIIEDGSHHSDDQINTFRHLFHNNLKPGGLYVLEDLHCCVDPYWWRSITSFEGTFLHMLQTGNLPSEEVKDYKLVNDSIAFIFKNGNIRGNK
jgi:SAM-dependent methyltransferase